MVGRCGSSDGMPQNRVARILADEDGTDCYFVVNVRGGTTLGPGIDLSTGIDQPV